MCVRVHLCARSHATLCVEDLNPRAVAADPPPLPRYSSSSMAATAGILLLVSGPTPLPHSSSSPSSSPLDTHAPHTPSSARQPLPSPAAAAGSPLTHSRGAFPDGAHAHAYGSNSGISSGGTLQAHARQGNGLVGSTCHDSSGGRGRGEALTPVVQAELAGSWEDLRVLLCGMAPGVQVRGAHACVQAQVGCACARLVCVHVCVCT